MPILSNAWRLSRLQALRWSHAVRARKRGSTSATPGCSQPLSSTPPLTPQSSNPSSSQSSREPNRTFCLHRSASAVVDRYEGDGQGPDSLAEGHRALCTAVSRSAPELRAAANDGSSGESHRGHSRARDAIKWLRVVPRQGAPAADPAWVPPCPVSLPTQDGKMPLAADECGLTRVGPIHTPRGQRPGREGDLQGAAELTSPVDRALPPDRLERFLRAYDGKQLSFVAASWDQASHEDDVGSCVAKMRENWSALSPSEQAVLERHFLRDDRSKDAGTLRFVALDEALSLFSSTPPPARARLLRALQALPGDRFDGNLVPLLRVWRHSTRPSLVWRECMVVAEQICPKAWDIDTFVAMLDWLAGLDSVVWRRLQRVAVPVIEVVERRTRCAIEPHHAERYAEVLAVAVNLPPNLLDDVAAVFDCIVDDEGFEDHVEVSLYTIATVLDRAWMANDLTPASWQIKQRVELMESLAELTPEQCKTLERLGPHLLDEVEKVLDEAVPEDASQEWGRLLASTTSLPASQILAGIRAVGADSFAELRASHGKQRLQALCCATERVLQKYEARKHFRLAYLPTLKED